MKTKNLIVLAVLGLMSLACADKESNGDPVKEPGTADYTVVAQMEQAVETRTTLAPVEGTESNGVNNLLWTEGDKVNVVVVNANKETTLCELVLTEGAGTVQGTFAGTLKEGETPVFLVSPSVAAFEVDAEKKTCVLPSVYGDVETDYTRNPNAIMIADLAYPEEDGSFYFTHLGGILEVPMTGVPANAKGVVLNVDRDITGTFEIDEVGGNSVIKAGEVIEVVSAVENNKSITLLFKPKNENRDEVFYFPLPVGTYTFSVEYINEADEKVLIANNETAEIRRAGLVKMPSLLASKEPAAKITFSNVTNLDADIKIEPNAPIYYYIQPIGMNVADMEKEEKSQKINALIASAVSSTDFMEETGYEGSFLALYRKYYKESAVFNPGHTYFVAVIGVPQDADTEPSVIDVTYELVTFKGYEIDNTASGVSVTFGTPTETLKNVSVRITPAEGTYFRCGYMDYDKYVAEYQDKGDEALMNFVVDSGENTKAGTLSVSPTEPGKEYMVVVYAYNPATAKGRVFTKKLSCPEVVYNEAMSLKLDVLYTGVNYAEVKIEPVGGEIASIRYGFMKKTDFEANEILMMGEDAVEAEMVKDNTVKQRRGFNTDNLSADHVYKLENLYLYEPDQYLFVVAMDKDGKWVHMEQTVIDTKKPFDDGFDASLAAPAVKDVYYISSSTGYTKALTEWSNMSDVTDPTTLNGVNGMYWLDLDWGTPSPMKRMWLCNEPTQNWKNDFALSGTDKKADAIVVLKKRAGYLAGGTAPDFYGRNSATGALSLTNVQVLNTSEYKALRDKSDESNIKAKTLYFVWETTDGKYGYASVVPEDYLGENTAQ